MIAFLLPCHAYVAIVLRHMLVVLLLPLRQRRLRCVIYESRCAGGLRYGRLYCYSACLLN